MSNDINTLLSQYSQPVKSWPGEEWMDEEARANAAASQPQHGTPVRPDEAYRGAFLPFREMTSGQHEWAVPGFLHDVWDTAKAISGTSGFGTGPAIRFSSMPQEQQDQIIHHAMAGALSPLMTTGFARAAMAPRLPVGEMELGIFGGRQAKTANMEALSRAEEMAASGVPREKIWADTGWFQGVDGAWRFEIDDSASYLRTPQQSREMLDGIKAQRREKLDWVKQSRAAEKEQPDLFPKLLAKDRGRMGREAKDLAQRAEENYGLTWNPEYGGRKADYAFSHDPLFQAYPEIGRKTIVRQNVSDAGPRGSYDPRDKSLTIYRKADDPRSVGLHELQHAVQTIEGTARGGSQHEFPNTIRPGVDAVDMGAIMPIIEKYGVAVRPHDAVHARDYLNKVFDEIKHKTASIGELDPLIAEMNRIDGASLTPFDQYRRLAGEVEARAVQARKDLSPQERRRRPPWEDFDVPEANQTVAYWDGPNSSSGPSLAAERPSIPGTILDEALRGGRSIDPLGYYSPTLEAARRVAETQRKGTPEQILAQMKKLGAKEGEIQATGLSDFLSGRNAVTTQEIMDHLEGNRVGLQEKIYNSPHDDEWGGGNLPPPGSQAGRLADRFGNDGMRFTDADGNYIEDVARDLAGRPSRENNMDVYRFNDGSRLMVADGAWDVMGPQRLGKWSSYSLDPSNPTYRETVLHLPEGMSREIVDVKRQIADVEEKIGRLYERHRNDEDAVLQDPEYRPLAAELERLTEPRFGGRSADYADFTSGHFPEPNIVGHMMTSMTTHEGRPVFTIDQIQSDWGQKLRDGGVRDEAKIKELKARKDAADKRAVQAQLATQEYEKIEAPFRGPGFDRDTWRNSGTPEANAAKAIADEWVAAHNEQQLLAAELQTAEASSPGHPLVNTTDQWVNTTLRRGLRQAVDSGAEYIAIPTGDTVLSYNPGDTHGMRTFYGSVNTEKHIPGIVPKNMGKLLGKIDPEAAKPVYTSQLETPTYGMKGEGFTLFRITPKVRESVMKDGQPLFAMSPSIPGTILDEGSDRRQPKSIDDALATYGRADGGAVSLPDPMQDMEGWAKAVADDLHSWGSRQAGPWAAPLSFGADALAEFPEAIVSGAKLGRAPGQWWRGEPVEAGLGDALRVGLAAAPIARPFAQFFRAPNVLGHIPIDRTGAAQKRIKSLLDAYNKD